MFRSSLVGCFLGICIFVVAQPANAQDKIWHKYDLQSIVIPPPNVVYGNAPVRDLSTQEFTSLSAPAQRVMRGIEGSNTTITTPKSISVHGTPDMQQRIAENIAHLQRPETQKTEFVMEINYLTLGNVYEHQFGTHNPENVVWKESRYGAGLLKIGTGRGNLLPPKIDVDVDLPIHPYLRPISNLKGKTTQSGVHVYWVAKEDIPKMQEAWNKHVHNLKGDSRFRHHFQSQPVVVFNGQLGVNRENVSFPFTLSEKKWYRSSPTQRSITADTTFASVSFISVDDRTVSSDIDICFPQFPKRSLEPSFTLLSIGSFTLLSIDEDSFKMDYLTISEKNLIWAADGMLVVLMSGIPLMSEGKIEKKESGVPLLNRKHVYSLTEHEIQALTGVLTIKMVSRDEAR